MNFQKKFFIYLFILNKLYGCTLIKHFNESNDLFLGRTMDFAKETFPNLTFFKNKEIFASSTFSENSEKIIQEKRLYPYIGISVFGNENLICQGTNEVGLHVSTLWFPDASYIDLNSASKNKMKKEIEISEVSDFILSCFSNVSDVKDYFLDVLVWSKNHEEFGGNIPVHFSVIDKNGNEIILESINGNLKIYESEFGVFTNAPSFDWHVKNLRNYIKIDAKSITKKEISNFILKQNGFGNGLFGIPGDFTSPSRFVRAFYLKNNLEFKNEKLGNDAESTMAKISNLMTNLSVLPGFEKTENEYTQWHILLLNNEKMYVKFFDEINYLEIDLKEIFLNKKNGFSKSLRNFNFKSSNSKKK